MMYDLCGAIMDFESGQLDDAGTLVLFSNLIKSGQAWSLQGSYGRYARALITGGYITDGGDLTEKAEELNV
jgi:hypothetical protein